MKTVQEYLNEVDYSFEGYIPSDASLTFINFIKLVNGASGEENKTPITHFKLLDNVFSKKSRLAILAHRGFSKSTILSEYLFLYIAVFGKLDNFGEVNYAIYVGDSAENGCRNVRKNMENRYNNSEFLQEYLSTAKFTDTMIEFTNKQGKQFAIKLVGAQQSLRGTRYLNKRPELCVADDILTDADAKSPTCIANVENMLHKAVSKALHPTKNKIIYVGTVFSASDPLYKAIESGVWSPSVFPVCEEFPCTEEEFKGSWEDRFPYSAVKSMYDEAIAMGRLSDFNSEMMNRVMSDDDRLIQETDITWYNRETVLSNKGKYNFYITTDFATSEKSSSDYSAISVWAYNSNGDWLWVDGICKRQLMDKNVDELFRLAQKYKPQLVGIEVSGQQGGFVSWIQDEMLRRNIYFTLASDNNSNTPGIRPCTNKMQRFQVMVPLFKLNKIWFPRDMKADPALAELMEELRLTSVSGFKSRHDDMIDNISMLSVLKTWKPSEEVSYTTKEGNTIYDSDEEEEESSYVSSYIV